MEEFDDELGIIPSRVTNARQRGKLYRHALQMSASGGTLYNYHFQHIPDTLLQFKQ